MNDLARVVVGCAIAASFMPRAFAAAAVVLTPDVVNDAGMRPVIGEKATGAAVLRAEV